MNIKLIVRMLPFVLAAVPAPLMADQDSGEKHFSRCVACHLAEGQGIPGAFPPLKDRLAKLTHSELGRQYVVQVIYGGLMGLISVNGQSYSGVMPAQAGDLSAKNVSDMLNYAVNKIEKDSKPSDWVPFSEAEILRLSKTKGNPMSNGSLRKQLLEKQPELK